MVPGLPLPAAQLVGPSKTQHPAWIHTLVITWFGGSLCSEEIIVMLLFISKNFVMVPLLIACSCHAFWGANVFFSGTMKY